MVSVVIQAVAGLEETMADFEAGALSGADAAKMVDVFAKGERLCATGKAMCARRATEASVHRREGHRSPAAWLAARTGDSVGDAVAALSTAQAAESLPHLGEALRGGEISPRRAAQVADAAKANPAAEAELVQAAKCDSMRGLRERAAQAKAAVGSTESESARYEALRRSRYLRHWSDPDGAFHLDARLTPDDGARVAARIAAMAARISAQARAAGVSEPRSAHAADALVALVGGAGGGAAAGPGIGQADTRASTDGADGPEAGVFPPSPRLDPELWAMENAQCRPLPKVQPEGVTCAGAGATSPVRPDRRADPGGEAASDFPPAQVSVRIDIEALRRGYVEGDECCEIPGVGPVPAATARALLGDAWLRLIITDGADVATVCHAGRTIPAHVRSALLERDRACVVPGCDIDYGLEIDHWVVPVVEHGPTELANLARLCHFHHVQKTHHGFVLEGGPGRWTWIPPPRPSPSATGPPPSAGPRSAQGPLPPPAAQPGQPSLFDTADP
ncbi:MAG: HNH endonuclease signature motif containing protein [Acidimicrobiales bacterium]